MGHFLPADMPREQKARIVQAEALWRAGLMKVSDIASAVGRDESVIYTWARTYHWPPRRDVVAVARNALNLEIIKRAASRAGGATPTTDAAGVAPESSVSGEDSRPATSAPAAPPGTIDFSAERARRPMSEEETRKLAISEQAAADAEAARLTNEFAIALSEVVDKQRKTVNELAAWGAELLADARKHREDGKAKLAELRRSKGKKYDSTRAINEAIGQFQRISMAMRTVIDMQWRVWQLDALSGGGVTDANNTPVVPVNAGSYEDYVHAAERSGMNLTPP